MTTAYTSLLGLALPVTGELSGTWGDTVNNSITSLLDSAISGTTTISTDADITLTTTTGAANEAREAIILWTAGGTVTRNITAPAQSKTYIVINKSSSTQSIVLRGVGPTTGVTIVVNEKAVCAWNGSDFVKVSSTVITNLTGTLPVANGGTGVTTSTGTGNTVLSTSPTLVTPILGTPTSGTLTSCTGLPLSTGVTGTLPVANGGTGLTTTPANGALDIGNGTGFTRTTLTAGSGVAILNTAGGITISATGAGGTITSVTGTSPVVSSGGTAPAISLAAGYGDTLNPYASKTANFMLAAPDGSAGVPTFRAMVAADVPTLNQNTTGSAATLTTTRAIYGNNFNGSAALTQVIASTYGGTGNGFTKFTGATTAEKTYTLPDASATILTSNAAVTVAQGGTGLTTTPANGALDIGNGTGFTRATLTAGTGVTITNGAGTISIAATGTGGSVTSVGGTGTVNGITLSGTVTSSGNLTLGGALSGVSLTTQVSGTLPVANGGTGVTTSTGSGNVVLSTSPTLVTPILGTPTSGNLANCTFPTLNQNTTGTAAGLSATLAVASGGTGVTTSTGSGNVVLSTSPTLTTPNINSAQFATVSGTAPIYPCRAWVNFNGTGTIAIRASGNVSSLTDNGTGDYTINFTTAMPDANYTNSGNIGQTGGASGGNNNRSCQFVGDGHLAASVQVVTGVATTSALEDMPFVFVSVFR